jgi:putative membrane protein insertion efficiency factor
MIANFMRALVRSYRWFISPLLPQACRFFPSCSEYAEEALQRHGALHGGWLAACRVCRCGPWHAGGPDPVP